MLWLRRGLLSGSQSEKSELLSPIWLTESPESESSWGFFVTCWYQRLRGIPAKTVVLSVPKPRVWVPNATIWLLSAPQKYVEKLSGSLFNTPLKFNEPVATGARKQPARTAA